MNSEKDFRRDLAKKHYFAKQTNSTRPKKFRSPLKIQSTDVSLEFLASDDGKWCIKMIEDILVLMKGILSSKTKSDIISASLIFIKLRIDGPLLNVQYIEAFSDYISKIFSDEDIQQIQSLDDIIDDADAYLKMGEDISRSPLLDKLYKCAMYSMARGWFESIGMSFDTLNYTKLEAEALKRKFQRGPTMVHCFLSTFIFILKRGRSVMKTGKFEAMFHSGESYDKWSVTAERLHNQSRMTSHPDISGVHEADFLRELTETIEKGECILSYSQEMSEYDRRFVRRTVNGLKMLKFDHVSKAKAKESRDIPFSIMVFSPPKMGKSSVMHNLRVHYARIRGLQPDKKCVYTRNPVADHWDGYDNSYWGCIFDDIAFLNPNTSSGPDPSVSEFLQAINGESYVTKQAELENKGSVAFKSEWCVATTNTMNLNAHFYFSCPSAVQRRFPYIVIPKVKPEYQDDSGCLDATKVPIPEHLYDYWTWSVKKVISQTNPNKLKNYADYEDILQDVDLATFMDWYTEAILTHRRVQDQIRESGERLCEVKYCLTCYRPQKICKCQVQSFDKVHSLVNFFGNIVLGQIFGWLVVYLFLILMYIKDCYGVKTLFGKYRLFREYTRIIEELYFHFIGQYFRRQYWTSLGERIGHYYPGHKRTVAILAGLSVGLMIHKFVEYFFKLNAKVQGKSSSKGVMPEPDKDERTNPWYADKYELTTFDFDNKALCAKNNTQEDIVKIIERNLVFIKVEHIKDGKEAVRYGRMTCISGQVYMTNNHLIPESAHHLTLTEQSSKEGVTRNLRILISNDQVTRFPERDICFISIRNLPPKKDISFLFPGCDMRAKMNGFYLARSSCGNLKIVPIKKMSKMIKQSIPEIGAKTDLWSGFVDPSQATANGDCGSLMMGKCHYGYVILGMHIMGNLSELVYSTSVDKEFVQGVLETFQSCSVQSGTPMLSSVSKDRKLGTLHAKSPIRYVADGTAAVYGSFLDFRGKPKSRVEPTPIFRELSPHGYKIKYGRPEMSSWEPWRIALLDMVNPVTELDQSKLDACVKSFRDSILNGLSKERLKQVEIYDNFTAVNGAAGVRYVDKINRATSAGNPWKISKKYFLTADEPQHGLNDPVKVDEEIMNRAAVIIDKYESGETCMPNFCAHLKDEPVSFAKVKAKKTRVFTGAPFDWTIVVRKYLLSIIRVVQNERYLFEAAPGTIAQSLEWEEMYKYLTAHGDDQIVAGDYKAFDKRMPPQIILAAFDIIHDICEASGNYSDLDLKVVRGIAYDTAFPMVDFNGDLVQFYGSNPSGHPLTVIINSLVNSLYMRYCYLTMNPDKEIDSFKKNVNLITYGDDNAMGISKDIPWFHHTSIQTALKEIGITYTMADKEAESIPYINIKDTSFLKRSWKYDDNVGAQLCPLDHDSIEKMLMVWTRSKTISAEEQVVAVISSAIREYFFYGKEIFEAKSSLLKTILKEKELELWITDSTFPTYNQLKEEFWKNS